LTLEIMKNFHVPKYTSLRTKRYGESGSVSILHMHVHTHKNTHTKLQINVLNILQT